MEFIRGDTYNFKICRKDSSGDILAEVVDEMYFTVKSSFSDEEFKFQKKLSDGTITFSEDDYYYYVTIDPEDTDDLKFKEYVYDIEIINNNQKKTKTGKLILLPEATTVDNEV